MIVDTDKISDTNSNTDRFWIRLSAHQQFKPLIHSGIVKLMSRSERLTGKLSDTGFHLDFLIEFGLWDADRSSI